MENSVPMILDARGNLVWQMPFSNGANDFRVQEYRGDKYLTYWHEGGSWSMVCPSDIRQFVTRINSAGPTVIY